MRLSLTSQINLAINKKSLDFICSKNHTIRNRYDTKTWKQHDSISTRI